MEPGLSGVWGVCVCGVCVLSDVSIPQIRELTVSFPGQVQPSV